MRSAARIEAERDGAEQGPGRILADVVVLGLWPNSTVPFCTASSTCRPGTISPAAKTWIWNLPSVASDTYFEKRSQVPYNVSSDFGQLAVNRHFKVGDDCAIAGAAIAVAAAPAPIAVKNWRRFICSSIWASARFLFHAPISEHVGQNRYNAAEPQSTQGRNYVNRLVISPETKSQYLSLNHDLGGRRGQQPRP